MFKKLTPVLVLVLLAVVVQTLLPLISGSLTIANPFIALLAVLSLRSGKTGGVLWGALLGGLSDAYFLPYVGFHGVALTLAGYVLGWIGTKVVIRGVLPLAIFCAVTYLWDAGVLILLHLMLGLPLASPIVLPILLGTAITSIFAACFEAVARRTYPPEGP